MLPEEPGRPEDEDADQDAEDDRVRPVGRQVAVTERIDEPEHDRSDHGSLEVADPAQHGGGERVQAEPEAEVPDRRVVVEDLDDASGAGEGTSDEERDRDRAVHVDAHQSGRIGILGRGTHRPTLPRRPYEPGQHDEEWDGHDRHEDLLDVDRDAFDPEDRQDVGGPEDVVDALVAGARQEQGDVLEDEAHADRRDEGGELRRVAQRFVGDALDRNVQGRRAQHHDPEDQQDDADLEQDGRIRGDREDRSDQQERAHRTEHEDVAVGEVDELDDAVDEGVAKRHEGEDHPVRQADDLGLEELLRTEHDDAEPPGRPGSR